MNKIYILLFFSLIFISLCSSAQSGTWTWISGDSANNATGVYGTQGVPSVNNHPPALFEPAEWKDKQGNFWLYGGVTAQVYSDLWEYNPLTNEWTWVKGNGLVNQPPIYGIKGIANAANSPGNSAYGAASWVDTAGNFWLLGGLYTNSLWQYNIATDNWTWMSGDSVSFSKGVHGTKGLADTANVPGARSESCSAWTDSFNNLWLFGGTGFDDSAHYGLLNDLCRYNIATNEWTWMNGSAYINFPANYGVKGIENRINDPGARLTYTKWKDTYGNFWIMGGGGLSAAYLNDVWEYDLSSNEWVWMDGPDVAGDSGNYAQTCVADTINMPYSRYEQRSAVTDNCGRFWLFGGSFTNFYSLNDLWVFDPQQLKWEWLNGTDTLNETGNYGTFDTTSPANIPPSREGAVAWWSNTNQLYMFGGARYGIDGTNYFYADLWVYNPDTNCVPVCSNAAVLPPVAGFQSNKTTLCANDCINFTNNSANATSWQWYFAGALDSTSTAQNPQTVCYQTAGIYNVTLIASNSVGSDTLTLSSYISVKPAPPTPVITQVNDTMLYCSTDTSYTSYKWYLDSTFINGATDTSIVIHQGGNYNVRVTNASGCEIAGGINIVLGLQNYMSEHVVSVSPDPVRDQLTVYGLRFTVAAMSIYNVLGQETSPPAPLPRRGENAVIDVSALNQGVYFVVVVGDKGRWVAKFVKE